VRFAYADPPYVGQARKHYAKEAAREGRVASEVDQAALIERLVAEFPDGWAFSCSSTSARSLWALTPRDTRMLAWVKPFAMPKKNVYPMYAWEPVLMRGGRRQPPTSSAPDWHLASRASTCPDVTQTAKGAKPVTFCLWLLKCLGFEPGDEMVDLFPGTGTMGHAVRILAGELRMAL
jgi:hypothetical protein